MLMMHFTPREGLKPFPLPRGSEGAMPLFEGTNFEVTIKFRTSLLRGKRVMFMNNLPLIKGKV